MNRLDREPHLNRDDLKSPMEAGDLVRTAAFRLLLMRAESIATAMLAEVSGIDQERLALVLDQLDTAGRIRRTRRVMWSAPLG